MKEVGECRAVSRWQIERYEVIPPQSVGNARARWEARRGVIVTLWDDRGAWGQGECAPLPGYSPDALDACESALRQALSEGSVVSSSLPSARFALESARLDLEARVRGVSLARLLCDGDPLARVARSALVGAASDEGMVAQARSARARGCATMKVKIGASGAFETELEGLRALRGALGDAVALRLDANGAWAVDEAREKLSRLAELSPELVEQPVAGEDVFALGACAVPWAADECLQDASVAERVLSAPPAGCVAVVLKAPLVGGVLAARAMAIRAQAAGLGVIVTHAFEGVVAMAAHCALALSLPVAPWACGLDAHAALGAWDVALPQHAEGGAIVAVEAPGTGLPRVSARQIRA